MVKIQKIISLDAKLYDYLKSISDEEERSMNNLVYKILKEYQKKNEKK